MPAVAPSPTCEEAGCQQGGNIVDVRVGKRFNPRSAVIPRRRVTRRRGAAKTILAGWVQ